LRVVGNGVGVDVGLRVWVGFDVEDKAGGGINSVDEACIFITIYPPIPVEVAITIRSIKMFTNPFWFMFINLLVKNLLPQNQNLVRANVFLVTLLRL